MAEERLITDELRASVVGREGEPVVSEIEKGAIRRFAEAIGDPNPLYYDEGFAKSTKYGGIIAPPTFLCTLRSEMPRPVDLGLKRRLNGGNEFELIQPLRPGDVITARGQIVDLYERAGRMGRMVFTVSEFIFTNQKGEIVGKSRNTGISY